MEKFVSGIITVEDAKIISVEKGNVEKDAERHVCAFSVESIDSELPIKVLLKGAIAKLIYETQLKDKATAPIDESLTDGNEAFIVTGFTTVSFTGEIREIRSKEIVVENPDFSCFERSVTYEVFDAEPIERPADQA